jgi:hypothetical protein
LTESLADEPWRPDGDQLARRRAQHAVAADMRAQLKIARDAMQEAADQLAASATSEDDVRRALGLPADRHLEG